MSSSGYFWPKNRKAKEQGPTKATDQGLIDVPVFQSDTAKTTPLAPVVVKIILGGLVGALESSKIRQNDVCFWGVDRQGHMTESEIDQGLAFASVALIKATARPIWLRVIARILG